MKTTTIKNKYGYIRYSQIGTKEYFIEMLYINPKYRGVGYAKNLMNEIFFKLPKGIKKVWLVVSSNFGADLYRLINFYKKFGFQITGSDGEEPLMVWNWKKEF
jgi:ribosomal protein S18 acetylase RimI-like enzyme